MPQQATGAAGSGITGVTGQKQPAPAKKKRVVRTQAGANRYKTPIGGEIGSARNQQAAKAQQNQRARGNYGKLTSEQRANQQAFAASLSDKDLQELAQVAYSFKSSDPSVVASRIAIANALAKRGMNVNDFGGLGRGSGNNKKRPAPRGKIKAKVAPVGRQAKNYGNPATRGYGTKAATGRAGSGLNLSSISGLRSWVNRFRQVPDNDARRPKLARALINQAIELSATHLIGTEILLAAEGVRTEVSTKDVIELAGKWKHGWIPLDAAAISAKTKGDSNAKHWWAAPKAAGTNSGRSGRSPVTNAETGGRFAPQTKKSPTDRAINQLKMVTGRPSPAAGGGNDRAVRDAATKETDELWKSSKTAISTLSDSDLKAKRNAAPIGSAERQKYMEEIERRFKLKKKAAPEVIVSPQARKGPLISSQDVARARKTSMKRTGQ